MHAAIVEFNALTDADGAAADGHETFFGACLHVGKQVNARCTVGLVGRVVVRGFGRKFRRTRVNHAVDGVELELVAALHDGTLVLSGRQRFEAFRWETGQRIGDVSVAEAVTLPKTEFLRRQFSRRDATLNDAALHLGQAFETVEEPSGDAGDLVHLLDTPIPAEGFEQGPHAAVTGNCQPIHQRGIRQRLVSTLRHAFTLGLVGSGERTGVSTALFQ